jgi:hypothetical protein
VTFLIAGYAVVRGRRLPLADNVLLARGALESPNRRIDMRIRENVYDAHRAAAPGISAANSARPLTSEPS